MKKIIIFIIAFLVLALYLNKYDENYYVIPNESIRIRIIANSNTPEDQYIKIKTKQIIEEEIQKDLEDSTTIEESRKIITNNIKEYVNIIKDYLKEKNYNEKISISYGNNYFPEKEYKGVKYESGEYESLVIKLGKAQGDNWWCVLFPPICSLEVEENQDVEYKLYVKEIFDKYIKVNN